MAWWSASAVQGWVALGAAVAAVATFVASRLDGGREQAASVFVIASSWRTGRIPADLSKLEEGVPIAHTKARIRNGSSAPIFEVNLSAWDRGRRRRL